MKAVSLTFILILLISLAAEAQFITEDTKGQSTILFNGGGNLNLNLAATSISANWNNLRHLSITKPNTLLLGASVYGKSNDGLVGLVGDGDFVPTSRLTGLIGLRTKTVFKSYDALQAVEQELRAARTKDIIKNYESKLNYRATAEKLIDDSSLPMRNRFKNIIVKIINKKKANWIKLKESLDSLNATFRLPQEQNKKHLTTNIVTKLEADHNETVVLLPEYNAVMTDIEALSEELNELRANSKDKTFFIFLTGGKEATKIHRFDESAVVTELNKRFTPTTYRSDFIDLNMNLDIGARWLFGFAVGYQRANTFDSLSKKSYTVRTTETVGSQQLITEKTYEGYAGFFGEYDRINLKSDALYFAKIDDDFRIAWNVIYTRWYQSQNNEYAHSITNIGTAVNFYKVKGKFVGGFYLEEKDAFDGNELKDSDFWKRLSFGVVGKYTFGSVLDRNW